MTSPLPTTFICSGHSRRRSCERCVARQMMFARQNWFICLACSTCKMRLRAGLFLVTLCMAAASLGATAPKQHMIQGFIVPHSHDDVCLKQQLYLQVP